ncbi:MAG: cyclodeaminase/cyclohydrolase family protein [Candidatus Coatesbacteria bacterium]|nr:MAG: cyclodeaminase/cyclohydrolase family protein [Candidatus Coatesbacteria bacterium]
MDFRKQTLEEFVSVLKSSDPVPGGGSAAAFSGALGAALLSMVGEITMGKKKPEDKSPIEEALAVTKPLVDKFIDLITEDAEAFDAVMAAFKMPKETEGEKVERSRAIEAATIVAADVPLLTARTALEAVRAAKSLAEFGSKSAISDVACGVLMLESAFTGALYNVKINIPGISDEEVVERLEREVAELSDEMAAGAEATRKKAEERLS